MAILGVNKIICVISTNKSSNTYDIDHFEMDLDK